MKMNVKYLLIKGFSRLEIIKKYRKELNFNVSIQEINNIIFDCKPILKKFGRLMGCAGAEEGCQGYPRCFEVRTCLTCNI